ncbi:MAG: type 4a pilus biogenesis protein PilO [Armatimonadota bacterium]|nr:type 4a pilus biogenesis protein PilO [Armatimonadota bacterium]
MRGLSARERVLVALAVAGAIAAAFYLLVWTPQSRRQAELDTELRRQQTELARLKQLAETREEKEKEFQALADRIRLIEAKLPPAREIPRLIRQLQAVAAELGIKMNLLRPGATQAGPPGQAAAPQPAQPAATPARPGAQQPPAPPRYQLFRLDLAFDGSYADLMAFMARLEDFPRFIVLRQVSLAPGDLPRLKITIGAETFILPQGAPAPQ